MVYVAGTVGANMTRTPPTLCPGGIAKETACALENVQTVLKAAGDQAKPSVVITLENLVDCTIFVGDMARDYAALNEVWPTFFKSPPARAAFGASGLAMNAAAEFKCLATMVTY